jgi:class 3 adenylate cyclase
LYLQILIVRRLGIVTHHTPHPQLVNCASRIEGLEKDRHDGICRILVSLSTSALLYPDGRGDDGMVWERLGEFHGKGRQEALEIWERREGVPGRQPCRRSRLSSAAPQCRAPPVAAAPPTK